MAGNDIDPYASYSPIISNVYGYVGKGIILHGSALTASVIGLARLWKFDRLGTNLQSYGMGGFIRQLSLLTVTSIHDHHLRYNDT
jgi:hypothetical protein